MKEVLYGTVPCNSIGDTICIFSERTRTRYMIDSFYDSDIEFIALVHTLREDQYIERIIEKKNPTPTWSINFNFLDIQKKAKWFDRYYFIEGIHEKNYNEPWAQELVSKGLTSFYYTEPVNAIAYHNSPFWKETNWIIKDLDFIQEYQKKLFSFLEVEDGEYSTLHYTSLHYKDKKVLNVGDKRVSREHLIKWLSETACSEVRIIGNSYDVYATDRMLDEFITLFPDKKFINLCGKQDLEECLITIYNSKTLCCTETFSGFFGAILGIPTDYCWRLVNPKVFEKFVQKWGRFGNVNMFLDTELSKDVV